MLVRRSEPTISFMFDFFTIYSLPMWSTIFFSLLVFTAFGVLVHFTEWKLGISRRIQIGDVIWRTLRMQMNQNDKLEFRLSSGAFALWIFSLFQCLIILSTYQSYIISSAVKIKDPKPFKPEEVVTQLQRRKYSLATTE